MVKYTCLLDKIKLLDKITDEKTSILTKIQYHE